MINTPPPFKHPNIRIPITIPIKGSGFMDRRSGLPESYPSHEVKPVLLRLVHYEWCSLARPIALVGCDLPEYVCALDVSRHFCLPTGRCCSSTLLT